MIRTSSERYRDKQKGRRSEERFRHILSRFSSTSAWITKVEHSGTSDDEKQGIDFYVYTRTGWQIPVDVKSSKRGMRKHLERYGAKKICIIIMDAWLSDDEMLEKIIFFLIKWQEERIKEGIQPLLQ